MKRFGALLLACIAMATAAAAMNAAAQSPPPVVSLPPESRQSASNSLQRVDYAVLSAGRIVIKFTFRNEIRERPSVIVGYHPAANVVLDFADTVSELTSERIEIRHLEARSLQVLSVGNRTRAVVSMNRPVSYAIAMTGSELLLTLERHRADGR